nr:hypothetical protein [uncultured Sphingomonas sp.]
MRFIVQVGDAYYMTEGRNLLYDPERAKTDEERDGVENVAKKFHQIYEEPRGRFKAVILTDDSFSCQNVNRDD